MSNSGLVSYTKISPNQSGKRTHVIDRITPHCVVGQCSVETLGNIFAPVSRGASSNYGIGADGRVGMYVEEDCRSWCSSSNANDQRAVTIECASDTAPPYAFNDTVYAKLVDLCEDICRRNGKNKLIWLGDKNAALSYNPAGNETVLTVHCWFANKSCPGDWMMARMGELASTVTARLGGEAASPMPAPTASKSIDDIAREVLAGNWGNGTERKSRLEAAGYNYAEVQSKVNALAGVAPAPAPQRKSVDEVAREVINGKYGNGDARKSAIEGMGYNYSEVQAKVNSILGASSAPARKPIDEVAKEVIAGKWGNGQDRKNRLAAAGYNYSEVQAKVNSLLR